MEIRDRAPILLETGDRRKETGDRRQENKERRQETGKTENGRPGTSRLNTLRCPSCPSRMVGKFHGKN